MSISRPLSEAAARVQLAEICRRLYDKDLIAAGDGNVSMKLDSERVLVTPSGFHKGFLRPEDLIITDLHGKRLKGLYQPSSEFLMHEVCYAERPDINAVVHAHPPYSVALALVGASLGQCVLSETCLLLGPILTAPYSTPTTEEVPQVLRPFLRQTNALVLDRHGALTLGRTLDEAWHRMEAMEHAAKILHAAQALGPVTPLPAAEVDKLQELARRLKIPRAPEASLPMAPSLPMASRSTATSASSTPKSTIDATKNGGISTSPFDDALVEAVLQRLRR